MILYSHTTTATTTTTTDDNLQFSPRRCGARSATSSRPAACTKPTDKDGQTNRHTNKHKHTQTQHITRKT